MAFARIVNCLVKLQQATIAEEIYDEVKQLSEYLSEWWSHRPKRAQPLLRDVGSAQAVFPRVIFASPTAICGNTFYHCCAILRSNIMRSYFGGQPPFTGQHQDPIFHAREICAIPISNTDHANWVNHLQPLYIAGQALAENKNFFVESSPQAGNPQRPESSSRRTTNISEQPAGIAQYAAEKFLLLKHLQLIQAETGWKTDSRAKDLRSLWGLQ